MAHKGQKETSSPAVAKGEVDRYLSGTPRSRKLFEEAMLYLPGGSTRLSIYFRPYPPYMVRGKGCRVWDADGNEYIDFISNYTSLILGHSNPDVVAAASGQLGYGCAFGGPTESEIELAKLLCRRMPSIQRIRFTNSGTEATLNAMRAARAFTGKEIMAKFEGAYHGSHDFASVSVGPPLELAGPESEPKGVISSKGIPACVLNETLILPYNDRAAVEKLILKNKSRLAAVIVDPVMCMAGLIRPEGDFLGWLCDFARAQGILMIFDEVISFRLAPGGAQEYFGVRADLTALGKIIGGGFAIGAFGGRADIMALFDASEKDPEIRHAGTFNGNPVAMKAGLATVRQLSAELYVRLEKRCSMLQSKLEGLFSRMRINARVSTIGSLFNLHFTKGELKDYRSAARGDKALLYKTFIGLLNEGIMIASRGLGCISAAIEEEQIELFTKKLEKVLDR